MENQTVLIEPKLPTLKFTMRTVELHGRVYTQPVPIPQSEKEIQIKSNIVESMRKFISELIGTEPRWLSTANVFIATVTPEQLKIISAHEFVQNVQPNRSLV